MYGLAGVAHLAARGDSQANRKAFSSEGEVVLGPELAHLGFQLAGRAASTGSGAGEATDVPPGSDRLAARRSRLLLIVREKRAAATTARLDF